VVDFSNKPTLVGERALLPAPEWAARQTAVRST